MKCDESNVRKDDITWLTCECQVSEQSRLSTLSSQTVQAVGRHLVLKKRACTVQATDQHCSNTQKGLLHRQIHQHNCQL